MNYLHWIQWAYIVLMLIYCVVMYSLRPSATRQQSSSERAKYTPAERRAEALLCSYLTPEQRTTWQKERYVLKRIGGSEYVFVAKRVLNVVRREFSGAYTAFCIAPADPSLPIADVVLAQMLMLEGDMERFFRIANALWFSRGEAEALGLHRVFQPAHDERVCGVCRAKETKRVAELRRDARVVYVSYT